jgi:hypothetical protein
MPQSKWHYSDVPCACLEDGIVRSEQNEKGASLPTLASLDEEFGGANQPTRELKHQTHRRRWRHVWLLLPSAVLAAILAAIWTDGGPQLCSFDRLLPSSLAPQTVSGSSASELITELEALKKEIGELRYEQQTMSDGMTALQIAQRELQRSPIKTVSWHSEPNALLYQQIAPAPKPRTVALRRKITQPRPATQEANAEPENRRGPLPYPLED